MFARSDPILWDGGRVKQLKTVQTWAPQVWLSELGYSCRGQQPRSACDRQVQLGGGVTRTNPWKQKLLFNWSASQLTKSYTDSSPWRQYMHASLCACLCVWTRLIYTIHLQTDWRETDLVSGVHIFNVAHRDTKRAFVHWYKHTEQRAETEGEIKERETACGREIVQ